MYTPDWSENDIPVACSCKTCHGHCICTHTLLYGAVFEPRVRVPPEYIAKTVAERKRCKSAKGTAGRKRLKLLAELADDEKKTDSKVKYLKGTMPPPAAAAPATVHNAPLLCAKLHPSKVRIPSPVLPSSSDDDFEPEVVAPVGSSLCYTDNAACRYPPGVGELPGHPSLPRVSQSSRPPSHQSLPRVSPSPRQPSHQSLPRVSPSPRPPSHPSLPQVSPSPGPPRPVHAAPPVSRLRLRRLPRYMTTRLLSFPELTPFRLRPRRKWGQPGSRGLRNGFRDLVLTRPN
jgi:hypothetical protein